VLEIKCPFSLKSKWSYINAKDKISAKCVAQMQLQMFLSNRKSCLFCVAEPDFEISCKVSIREVKFDPTLLNDLIVKAAIFWNSAIWYALQCKRFRLNILISLCYNHGAEWIKNKMCNFIVNFKSYFILLGAHEHSINHTRNTLQNRNTYQITIQANMWS
jgi:hypothetical protein